MWAQFFFIKKYNKIIFENNLSCLVIALTPDALTEVQY